MELKKVEEPNREEEIKSASISGAEVAKAYMKRTYQAIEMHNSPLLPGLSPLA